MHHRIRLEKTTGSMAALAGVLLLAGCATQPSATTENSVENATTENNVAMGTTEVAPDGAIAVLNPTKDSSVRGTVTFTRADGGVKVVADLSGLTPGLHGFHIHENGDCSAPDASSAGGHFNPMDMKHGAPSAMPHHVGDFGNITADKAGKVHFEIVSDQVTFEGANSVIGRAVIVHAKADDLKSQPSGDAGGREACGVIGVK